MLRPSAWLAIGRGASPLRPACQARHFAADRCCPWLEQDILQLRAELERRREAFKEGRGRFRHGGNFTVAPQQELRRFGKERDEMKVEARKIQMLETRLEYLVQRFQRRCGGAR
mmetsp:Transcript_78990/g.207359  ORF Transcript_78990/g.207359 Transcript_78990/m.207359 type:complete len:114 (+) Transcript_78990:25-366(+)